MIIILTSISVVLGIAAVYSLVQYLNAKNLIQELEEAYEDVMDKYVRAYVDKAELQQELAKFKRKPRKDKGQTRNVYGGKPITRKRKIQEGEQGTNNSKPAK